MREASLERIDIDVNGARIPTEKEHVEAGIRRQLLREGFDDDELAVGAPQTTLIREGEGEGDVTIGAASVHRSSPSSPIRHFKDLQAHRLARIRTVSGDLVYRRGATGDFLNANKSRDFSVFNNAVEGNPHKRWVERIASRYCRSRSVDGQLDFECVLPEMSSIPASVQRVAPDEVILTVAVCSSLGHKEQEFDVLLSQSLYELRDAFHFASDWMFDGPTRAKSACFFIDGIFYSDMRDPSALDYSKELIDWLKATRGPGFLRAETSRTMEVQLCDLDRIPFGETCTYIHQGDIEHNIYFVGARLMHENNDCPLTEAFPTLTYMRRYVKRRCLACWQNAAVWLVLDSTRCPYNPSFWCAPCFRHFFQDESGDFIPPMDYKVFPYLHDDF